MTDIRSWMISLYLLLMLPSATWTAFPPNPHLPDSNQPPWFPGSKVQPHTEPAAATPTDSSLLPVPDLTVPTLPGLSPSIMPDSTAYPDPEISTPTLPGSGMHSLPHSSAPSDSAAHSVPDSSASTIPVSSATSPPGASLATISGSVRHIMAGHPTHGTATIVCDEAPPPCVQLTDQSFVDRYMQGYFTSEHARINQIYITIEIQRNSPPVCTLDPFEPNPLNIRSRFKELYLQIRCADNGFRPIFRPSHNLTSSLIWGTVEILNCDVYWKDMAQLGQYLDIRSLKLTNWRDEFEGNATEYFENCVTLTLPSQGIEDHTRQANKLMMYISNLANVGSLVVSVTEKVQYFSPAFTQYLWPVLGKVSFYGYVLQPTDGSALRNSMPMLQSTTFQSCVLLLVELGFPWRHESLALPYNLTISFYKSQVYGTQASFSNFYTKELVVLAGFNGFSWDVTFRGNLQRVSLVRCNIPDIRSYQFSQLKNLSTLDLHENRITHLGRNSFSGLANLLSLDLHDNRISSFDQNAFEDLTNLQYLNLGGNRLLTIGVMVFSSLHHLTSLTLSSNGLRSVSDRTFGDSPPLFNYLRYVNIDQNKLTEIPIWLLNTPWLVNANLTHNLIGFEGVKHTLSKMLDYGLELFSNQLNQRNVTLRNNDFVHFDASQLSAQEIQALERLLSYVKLDLRQNSFHCDCKIYEFYTLLRDMHISATLGDVVDYKNSTSVFYNNKLSFKCGQPPELRGQSLVEVPITTLGCFMAVSGCPQPCRCWVRSWDKAVRVDCRNKNLTHLPQKMPNHTIFLDLSANILTEIPSPPPKYLDSMEKLDLSNNSLQQLNGDLIDMMPNITSLRLNNNDLANLPDAVEQMSRGVTLSLSGNRFVCDCNSLWLKHWVVRRRHQITDIDQLLCASGSPHAQAMFLVSDAEFVCVHNKVPIIVAVSILASILALGMLLILALYRYRGEIKVILYMKFGWHPFDRADDTDISGKEFDAFLSYCHEDSPWVREELLPRLEDGQPRFRLCLHERDFVAGATVADNIIAAINTSRRMILILSNEFLRSHWCHLEFVLGHRKVLEDRTNYLILVLHEDVDLGELEEDMLLYVRTNTYLKRDNGWFWEKLRYAMPQTPMSEIQPDEDQNRDDNQHWSGVEALARAQEAMSRDRNHGNHNHQDQNGRCHHGHGHNEHDCHYWAQDDLIRGAQSRLVDLVKIRNDIPLLPFED